MRATRTAKLLREREKISQTEFETIMNNLSYHPAAFLKGVFTLDLMTQEALAEFIAKESGFSRAPKDLHKQASPDALGLFKKQHLERLEVIPLEVKGKKLKVATIDPYDHLTLNQVAFFSGKIVEPVIATALEIHSALHRILGHFNPTHTPFEKFIKEHTNLSQIIGDRPAPVINFDESFKLDEARKDESEYEDLNMEVSDVDLSTVSIESLAEDDGFDLENAELKPLDGDSLEETSEQLSLDESTQDEDVTLSPDTGDVELGDEVMNFDSDAAAAPNTASEDEDVSLSTEPALAPENSSAPAVAIADYDDTIAAINKMTMQISLAKTRNDLMQKAYEGCVVFCDFFCVRSKVSQDMDFAEVILGWDVAHNGPFKDESMAPAEIPSDQREWEFKDKERSFTVRYRTTFDPSASPNLETSLQRLLRSIIRIHEKLPAK